MQMRLIENDRRLRYHDNVCNNRPVEADERLSEEYTQLHTHTHTHTGIN